LWKKLLPIDSPGCLLGLVMEEIEEYKKYELFKIIQKNLTLNGKKKKK
jgi:hypothetical protein